MLLLNTNVTYFCNKRHAIDSFKNTFPIEEKKDLIGMSL